MYWRTKLIDHLALSEFEFWLQSLSYSSILWTSPNNTFTKCIGFYLNRSNHNREIKNSTNICSMFEKLLQFQLFPIFSTTMNTFTEKTLLQNCCNRNTLCLLFCFIKVFYFFLLLFCTMTGDYFQSDQTCYLPPHHISVGFQIFSLHTLHRQTS